MDKLEKIKLLWKKWERLKGSSLLCHKSDCAFLCGSRPDCSDCTCGKYSKEAKEEIAFQALKDAVFT